MRDRRHRTTRKARAVAALLGITAAVAVTGAPGAASTLPEGEVEEITVALANGSGAVYFSYYSAIEQGFFEEEGLDVTTRVLDGSGANLQALAAGQADIVNPGPGPVLNAIDQGQDVVMFYNAIARNILGIWVEADSEFQSLEDLAGADLGVGTADGIEVGFAKGVLSDAGLAEGDYDLVTVGDGGTAVAGFGRGDIDAYVGGGIDVAIMRARGLELRNVVPDDYLWAFANGFATTSELIDQRPEVVEGFGRALTRGLLWARENMDEAQAIAAEANPEEGEDSELARSLMETLDEAYEPLDGADFGYFPPEAWEMTQEQAVSAGDLEAPLENLEAAYTNDFVEAFNDVTADG